MKNKISKAFAAHEAEAAFLRSALEHQDDPDEGWEEVIYIPRASVTPRKHAYVVRMNDEEMAGLQALAKRKKQPVSDVIREFARTGLRRAVV
jgi:Ribbon-helix-helix protein, copG family